MKSLLTGEYLGVHRGGGGGGGQSVVGQFFISLFLYSSFYFFISVFRTSESQEELFIILMKSKETPVIKALGKYIYTAFKMREEHMSLL